VLQDRTFFRVGGSVPISVRTRVLAATLKDLDVEMREGRFRPDLFYRLNMVSIGMPSLSERREDIPILVDHFRSLWIRDTGKTAPSFHEAALGLLQRASWPGNVRQLKNVVDRLAASIRGEVSAEDVSRLVSEAGPAEAGGGQRLAEAREDFERRFISDVLAQEQGNVSRTAEVLGVDRHNLAKKLKKLGVRKGATSDGKAER
jgi:two-component system nitrogen regulation response regulator NtrX